MKQGGLHQTIVPMNRAARVARQPRHALLAAPPLLLASMYPVYQAAVALFGPQWGCLAGYCCYWIGWCLLFPLWALGKAGLVAMFRDARPRLGHPAWLGFLFLVLPLLGALVVRLPAWFAGIDVPLLLVSAVIAVVNGTLEEVLWRGTYTQVFPRLWGRGYLYPALSFALWHLVPASVMGHGALLLGAAAFMGLGYGWVAWHSRSIRWTTLCHCVTNFCGLIGLFFLGR